MIRMGVIITINGIVQGVGFRYWTKKAATSLNLDGTVSNQNDGSVIIHLMGERQNIFQFIDMARQGPSAAKVSEFFIRYVDLPNFEGFNIIR